jgi:acyl-CoA thioesterase-2
LLAYATDLTVIGTALRPLEGISQADAGEALHTAVTGHSVWFHRPFRIDDWCLISQRVPVVAGARAFGHGNAFDRDGMLVASFAQESMIRPVTA